MVQPVAPITCGSDLGVYAIARSFHEAFGVVTTTVAALPRGFINDSAIVRPRILGAAMSEEQQLASLAEEAEAARRAGREPVVIVNSDSLVDRIRRHESELSGSTLLIPPASSVAAVADKSYLAPLAASVGLRTPAEVRLEGEDWGEARSLPLPLIVKPAESGEWEQLSFPGKLKVYRVGSYEEVGRILGAAREAGFGGALLVQELIPGDDTAGYVTTQYVDRGGRVTLQSTARMLLALHTPNLLGNMALGLVDFFPEIAGPVGELLRGIGYRGFATADVKVHAQTGERYLLDINPRIGRSNYLVNIGGTNPLEVALDDAHGIERAPERTRSAGLYRIVPSRLVGRYVRDGGLRAAVRELQRSTGWTHPLQYGADRNLKRSFFQVAASVNHLRNLSRVYPRPTDSGL